MTGVRTSSRKECQSHQSFGYTQDQWAAEMLIPTNAWNASPMRQHPTVLNVVALAHQLGISPAIIAGRLRNERRNYRLLSQLVGNGQVRTHFAP